MCKVTDFYMSDIEKRVGALRLFMKENGYSAFIVVSSDPHSSEYVADCWKSREWISGFDGSAGTVVVTHDKLFMTTSRVIMATRWLRNSMCSQNSR